MSEPTKLLSQEPSIGIAENPSPDEPTVGTLEVASGGGNQPDVNIVIDNSGNNNPIDVSSPSYIRYGKSITYHMLEHYKNKTNGVIVTNLTNLRPCKTCQRRYKLPS